MRRAAMGTPRGVLSSALMGGRVLGWLGLLAALAGARPADARFSHRLSLAAGGELWLRPEAGGHGVVTLDYALAGLPRGAQLSIDYNTDTLRVAYEKIRLAGG